MRLLAAGSRRRTCGRCSCGTWGCPCDLFLLWHRLLAAVGAFSRIDATTAANAAGFSDLAHFSRTCRRVLGNSPTGLARALLR